MKVRLFLMASCACTALVSPARAELNLWQQNFVGCSASSSPYTSQVLLKDGSKVRPLMQVAGLNAWAVTGQDGEEQVALTTPDGLTIYGQIVGPQGEDISSALLGTKPTVTPEQTASNSAAPAPSAPVAQQLPAPAPQPAAGPVAPAVAAADAQKTQAAPVAPAAAPQQSQQLASVGSQNVPDVPKAGSIEQLMQQAKDFSMWFSVNQPKAEAPVVYVFVDPTCPHCAWSFEHLMPRIRDNTIDLRVILTPIRSAEAFDIAASILHQDNVAGAMLEHARSIIGSGKPVTRLDPKSFDQRVTDGLRRNVLWMRANGAPGVPFYIYRSNSGAQFAFGQLTDEQLKSALPEPTEAADAGAAAQ